jgi:hypothetical protein
LNVGAVMYHKPSFLIQRVGCPESDAVNGHDKWH